MKAKKLFMMLLLVIMMLAMVGTMAGCSGDDSGDDKRVEERDDEDDEDDEDGGKKKKKNKKDDEDEEKEAATATPEPTATPTPEVLPTAEELFDENKDMFDGKMKMSITFAYTAETEYGEMFMRADAEMLYYDDITYESTDLTVSLMDVTETMKSETYAVTDEDAGLRTEYSYDSDTQVWVKSQYSYVAAEEDEEDFPVESLTNVEITEDGAFYYLTGEVDDFDLWGDVSSLGVEGLEMNTIFCKFKFAKETKKMASAELGYNFEVETEDVSMSVDDMSITIESLTEPIVIPAEALAAELETETDWETIFGEDNTLPEPEKYTASEMPAGWGTWYNEYNCKSGTFIMWTNDTWESIPVTVYAKENWYFDNQYNYTLYLAVNDPEVSDDSPAYEVDYEDSEVLVADVEVVSEKLVTEDYNGVTTVEDVVPVVCDGRQCFYLDTTAYEYIRTFVIYQDIGLDSYVKISIMTSDLATDSFDIVKNFMLSIDAE